MHEINIFEHKRTYDFWGSKSCKTPLKFLRKKVFLSYICFFSGEYTVWEFFRQVSDVVSDVRSCKKIFP